MTTGPSAATRVARPTGTGHRAGAVAGAASGRAGATALSARAATGGRLALGVGPSHHWIIRDMLGLPHGRPGVGQKNIIA
jgi:hypothetical protein